MTFLLTQLGQVAGHDWRLFTLIPIVAAALAILGAVWKARGYADRITHQLEHNSHRSSPPTVRDEIDSAKGESRQARREVEAMRAELHGHVATSERQHDRIWRAIGEDGNG